MKYRLDLRLQLLQCIVKFDENLILLDEVRHGGSAPSHKGNGLVLLLLALAKHCLALRPLLLPQLLKVKR